MEMVATRRERILNALASEGIDALLVTNPINVTYLTGFTGDSSYLILSPKRTLLVSDGRFTEQLAEECPGLEIHIRPPVQNVTFATASLLRSLDLQAIGFESNHLTVGEWDAFREQLPAISWKGEKDRVEKLRAIKDAIEIEEIRAAIAIAERAFGALRALLSVSSTEKELCDALDGYVRRLGGQGVSFPSIVAVGPRSALPHAPPTAKSVGESPLLLVDWGASGRLYKSDLTRILVTRRYSAFARTQFSQASVADARLETVYRVVLQAQAEAIRSIRPGALGQEIDAAARKVIAEAGFGEYFTHGLGHGLGLQVHEAPALRPGSNTALAAGMIVTVEPGIYIPGWGGVRIEDDVLVTEDGCQVLSSLPRDWASALCDI